jgi:hypothetical protein
MTRLTALQLLDLNILSKEDSGDDSGDDSEYDNVEIIIRNEDGEVEEEEALEREEYDESACKRARLQVPEDLLTPEIEVNSNNAFNVLDKNKIFYGGINKKIQNLLNGFLIQLIMSDRSVFLGKLVLFLF